MTALNEVLAAPSLGLVHPGWSEAFPWLLQGCTTRGTVDEPYDFGLFSGGSAPESVRESWAELLDATGATSVMHGRQVHGADVHVHGDPSRGLCIVGECDGHATSSVGVLLAVTTADCVPVFLVDPHRRTVGVLHAGWRGTAAGVLEHGLLALGQPTGSAPADLLLHLGPAICGDCYEVGPEVFEALQQQPPRGARPIDLRGVLAARALSAGVLSENVTVSQHCTRCTDSGLFSHRGGDLGRHVGYIGLKS